MFLIMLTHPAYDSVEHTVHVPVIPLELSLGPCFMKEAIGEERGHVTKAT